MKGFQKKPTIPTIIKCVLLIIPVSFCFNIKMKGHVDHVIHGQIDQNVIHYIFFLFLPIVEMETRTSLQPQYCCWIELRLGCKIIGLIIIIESFILLSIHPDWDTHWNTVISLVSGSSVISGYYTYRECDLLFYRCSEVVHILFMVIAAFSHFVKGPKNETSTLAWNSTSSKLLEKNLLKTSSKTTDAFLYQGIAYSVSALLHCYFWTCINRLYQRYRQYTFLQNNSIQI